MNLGLSHAVNRAVRFTMHIGADIRAGLADPQLRNKRKANVLARGYEEGGRATPGCSYKGRIWSYRIANDISEWVALERPDVHRSFLARKTAPNHQPLSSFVLLEALAVSETLGERVIFRGFSSVRSPQPCPDQHTSRLCLSRVSREQH